MKHKCPLFSIVLLLFTFQANAQIENEIKSFVDSTEILVNNGRKMMVTKILDNDYSKAQEIYQYLTNITTGKNYSGFYFNEDIYLNVLFGDWNNLVEILLSFKDRGNRQTYQNVYEIVPALVNKISALSDSLSSECQNSNLDYESKRLLDIIFHIMKNGSDNQEYTLKLEAFEKEFENSRFNNVISDYLPKKLLKASLTFSIGSGVVFTTDKLKENFSSNASLNMSMDINIKRIFTSLYLNSAGLKLKVPFQATDGTELLTFNKDESFHYLDAGLKGGYFIVRSRKFHFSPYVSVSGSFLESKRYDSDEDEKEFEVFNSFTYGTGIHTEIKLKEFNAPNPYYGYVHSFISLKAEGGYNFISKFKDEYFKGNTPYITFALIWAIGEF